MFGADPCLQFLNQFHVLHRCDLVLLLCLPRVLAHKKSVLTLIAVELKQVVEAQLFDLSSILGDLVFDFDDARVPVRVELVP